MFLSLFLAHLIPHFVPTLSRLHLLESLSRSSWSATARHHVCEATFATARHHVCGLLDGEWFVDNVASIQFVSFASFMSFLSGLSSSPKWLSRIATRSTRFLKAAELITKSEMYIYGMIPLPYIGAT